MSAAEQSPLEQRARRLSAAGGPSGPALRHVLAELDMSRAEVERLRAHALERARIAERDTPAETAQVSAEIRFWDTHHNAADNEREARP